MSEAGVGVIQDGISSTELDSMFAVLENEYTSLMRAGGQIGDELSLWLTEFLMVRGDAKHHFKIGDFAAVKEKLSNIYRSLMEAKANEVEPVAPQKSQEPDFNNFKPDLEQGKKRIIRVVDGGSKYLVSSEMADNIEALQQEIAVYAKGSDNTLNDRSLINERYVNLKFSLEQIDINLESGKYDVADRIAKRAVVENAEFREFPKALEAPAAASQAAITPATPPVKPPQPAVISVPVEVQVAAVTAAAPAAAPEPVLAKSALRNIGVGLGGAYLVVDGYNAWHDPDLLAKQRKSFVKVYEDPLQTAKDMGKSVIGFVDEVAYKLPSDIVATDIDLVATAFGKDIGIKGEKPQSALLTGAQGITADIIGSFANGTVVDDTKQGMANLGKYTGDVGKYAVDAIVAPFVGAFVVAKKAVDDHYNEEHEKVMSEIHKAATAKVAADKIAAAKFEKEKPVPPPQEVFVHRPIYDGVKNIQYGLHELNLYHYKGKHDPDGIIGKRTQAGIEKAQMRAHITVDGIAGRQTTAAIEELVALEHLKKYEADGLSKQEKILLSEDLAHVADSLKNLGNGKAAHNITKLGNVLIKQLDGYQASANDDVFAVQIQNLQTEIANSAKNKQVR